MISALVITVAAGTLFACCLFAAAGNADRRDGRDDEMEDANATRQ